MTSVKFNLRRSRSASAHVVNNEPVVVGEVFIPHLRHFPSRQVEVDAVDEGHVVADGVWHRSEEMAGLHHYVDRLLRITEHRNARVTGHRFLAALELTRLAVGLERCDDLLGHLLEVGDFVERDHVPDLYHALVARLLVTEEVRDGSRPSEKRRVRGELLNCIALSGPAWAEFDEVVVAFAQQELGAIRNSSLSRRSIIAGS